MGFSAICLVKTLTSTAFSLYLPAVTACDRLFQQCGRSQVGPPPTFQASTLTCGTKMAYIRYRVPENKSSKKYVAKQKDVKRILKLPGEP